MTDKEQLQILEQDGVITVDFIREFVSDNFDNHQLTDEELLQIAEGIWEDFTWFMLDIIEPMLDSEDFSGPQDGFKVGMLPTDNPAIQPEVPQPGPSTTESP